MLPQKILCIYSFTISILKDTQICLSGSIHINPPKNKKTKTELPHPPKKTKKLTKTELHDKCAMHANSVHL